MFPESCIAGRTDVRAVVRGILNDRVG